MIRRALLLSAAVVAAVLAQTPTAHAGEICVFTVTLEGTIDETVGVPCLDYDHGTVCTGSSVGPVQQKVGYDVCVPDPVVN